MTGFPAATVTCIAHLVLTAPARAGATRVLAIDGRSGSGKTTLSGQLADALGDDAGVLHLDEVYPGWDGLLPAVPLLVEGVLRPLAAGRPARVHRWDWARDDWWRNEARAWREVPARPVLIVEGVGSGARACAPYLSALVWIEAPEALRHARAMRRDGESYRPHWSRWAAQESRYLAGDDPAGRADVTLDPQQAGVV
jgi:energy-coupling factor transporter ATP-binding protein EcfA2